jgi:hypothetical protein
VKVKGRDFPYLPLADASEVEVGQTVVAIGNPGGGMPNTVTKGIVSAMGHDASRGPGTWVQTDAEINHGNSGGPLLDSRGDVVGINTQIALDPNDRDVKLPGINFALSVGDLIQVLRRFYPDGAPAAPVPAPDGTGSIDFASDPSGAEIYVDGKFIGQTPSTVSLGAGSHHVELKASGKNSWARDLEVFKDSRLTLHPVLEPAP